MATLANTKEKGTEADKRGIFVHLCNGTIEWFDADHVYVTRDEVLIQRGSDVVARFWRREVFFAAEHEMASPILF